MPATQSIWLISTTAADDGQGLLHLPPRQRSRQGIRLGVRCLPIPSLPNNGVCSFGRDDQNREDFYLRYRRQEVQGGLGIFYNSIQFAAHASLYLKECCLRNCHCTRGG